MMDFKGLDLARLDLPGALPPSNGLIERPLTAAEMEEYKAAEVQAWRAMPRQVRRFFMHHPELPVAFQLLRLGLETGQFTAEDILQEGERRLRLVREIAARR